MTSWYDGPLAAFETETTGADEEADRVVSAALVVQALPHARPRVTRWLIDPGVPVPAAATGVHGLTDDFLHRNGRWPSAALEEIARALAEQCAAARPLVVMNAPSRLTMLDRELRRHRARPFARYLEHTSLCVLDPHVLDTHLDRYRKGRRALSDLCAQYAVAATETHEAAEDAAAALAVVRAVGRRFALRMERLTAPELHALQAVWHTDRARGTGAWFTRGGAAQTLDPAWPLRPELPTAA